MMSDWLGKYAVIDGTLRKKDETKPRGQMWTPVLEEPPSKFGDGRAKQRALAAKV